ncbi:MAG: hypothetical protein AABY15_08880 [Nanoarchaeota archaeon]
MTILKNILKFITDPKNTRMLLLAGVVILILLFLRQCNQTRHWKEQVEIEKQETQRISNNYEAAMDTINQYKVDGDTWRSEKSGYELTLEELNTKYSNLLGDFKVEKNKPPKTIIKTEYVIKEVINDVPVLVEIDSLGQRYMKISDSVHHDSINYRILNGRIPYEIVFDPIDSVYRLVPDYGKFDLTIGMNLNLGLFQDKDTRKITIQADTDYPGVTFTTLEGASIMDDPANKKILRNMRKPWSIGMNLGYGFLVNPSSGIVSTGPYFGVGISYSPKFLQWGR